jgi:hypothetical protein
VINPLVWVILPQLTFAAIIPCRVFSALNALLSRRLWCTAEHAQHILGHLAVERVREWKVCGVVVAVTAGDPPLAVVALNFDVPLVVYAS